MEKRKETGDKIMVCPQCGSTNISPHGKEPGVYSDEVAAVMDYHICNKCSFAGRFFPEVPLNKLKLLQEDIKKHKKK